MDTVLGVSMAPKTVRMVLVGDDSAGGVTVDEDSFDVGDGPDSANVSGPDQVISAILGTQEGATASGYQLLSTGVVWTDPVEAAALRDALADHKMENVMLVSAFLAAAALAQEVGSATGYDQTALLFVEPGTATLAVVGTADGSITGVRRQPLQGSDPAAELAALASDAEALPTRPGGLFVVGSGVDIAPIKPALEAATTLMVSAPEEPETALARGAALASANSPLFNSSTAAMAYARDSGTGAFDAYGAAARHADAAVGAAGAGALAYSALADDDANASTAVAPQDDADFRAGVHPDFVADEQKPQRRPLWMVASAVAAVFIIGVVALVIALAVSIRPHVGTRPQPGSNLVAPTNPAPNAPPPAAPAPNAPPPAAPAPALAPAPAAPAPEAPAPAPAAPAPAPAAPAPEIPAPAAPVAPPPVVPVPIIVPPPAPLEPPGGGHGGGGIPGIPGLPGGGGGHPGGGGHGGGGRGGFPGF